MSDEPTNPASSNVIERADKCGIIFFPGTNYELSVERWQVRELIRELMPIVATWAEPPDPSAAAPVSATVEQRRHRDISATVFFLMREHEDEKAAQFLADFEARAVADATSELQKENDFLHDLIAAFEWRRINAMDIKEVEKELLDAGYTREQLAAGLAKVRKIAEDAIRKAKETKP